MASLLFEEGVQRVSLSPSDSELDPGDMEPCADLLPMDIDEVPPGFGPCGVRFPADTSITPPAIGLTHAQWCDKIKDKPLPGDGPVRFTSAVSHQDQWWLSCACALHLLATRDGSLQMPKLTTCVKTT